MPKRASRRVNFLLNDTRKIDGLIDQLNEGRWWPRPVWERAIRRALAAGELSTAEIAEEFNASRYAVEKIANSGRRAA